MTRVADGLRFRSWYASGAPCLEAYLLERKVEGPVQVLWPNGKTRLSMHFRKGRREGMERSYRESGSLRAQCLFRDDTCLGHTQKVFSVDGKVRSRWNPSRDSLGAVTDSLTGVFMDYHGGAVIESTAYLKGRKEGFTFEVSESGDTLVKAWYRQGREDSTKPLWRAPESILRSADSLSRFIDGKMGTFHWIHGTLRTRRGYLAFLAFLDPDGTVSALLPIEATHNPLFIRSAVQVIQAWRFPALRSSQLQKFKQRINFE